MSCITHPPTKGTGYHFTQLRKEYWEICEPCEEAFSSTVRACAAKLLNYFEQWMNSKLDAKGQAAYLNEVSQLQGKEPTQDENLWVYGQSAEDLSDYLMEHQRKTIQRALDWLTKNQLLFRRKNPKPELDNAYQYQINVGKVQQLLNPIVTTAQQKIAETQLYSFGLSDQTSGLLDQTSGLSDQTIYKNTNSESISEFRKEILKDGFARSEVENSENFEFENGGAKPPLAVDPCTSLDATQGQPALAGSGVEVEREVLDKLRGICKVSKDLKTLIEDNPKAAKYALKELEYAISDGVPVKNPAGFFRTELKRYISRYESPTASTPKPQKNDQQAASTTPKMEIPYPVTLGGSEEAKPLEKVRRLSREEFNALPVGEYFYMSNGNLPKDLHGCGYGSRSPILWLYQIVTSAGGYSSVIDCATGKKINLGPIVMAHGCGKDRLGYTEEVHCYKPKSTFCWLEPT